MSNVGIFFKRFAHFFSGGALGRLFGFVTLPILTRILSVEQYGVLSLVTTTAMISVTFAKFGLTDGVIRFYGEFSKSSEKQEIFSSTIMIRGAFLALVTALLYIPAYFIILRHYLKISEEYSLCFFVIIFILLVRPINNLISNLLLVTGKTIFMNLLGLFSRASGFLLSVVFLIVVIKELYGFFVGGLVSDVIVLSILLYWFLSHYKVELKKVSKDLTLKLIKFGAPLVLTEFSYLLLQYVDRFFIVSYLGSAKLGIYSVGYNIAMYVSEMFVFSISYAITPIFVTLYEKEGKEKTEAFINKSLHYLLIILIPMVFGYLLVAGDVIRGLASAKYAEAAVFSPIVLVGTLLIGLNTNILCAGLYLKKKTNTILLIMMSGVVVNILLNLALIPKFGLLGAASSTLIAGILVAITTILFSSKFIRLRVDLKSGLYYLAVSMVMYAILSKVRIGTIWTDLVVKILVGMLLVGIGVAIKEKGIFHKKKEKESIILP
jgi:O-antigen/teichoic acid export membrane protein